MNNNYQQGRDRPDNRGQADIPKKKCPHIQSFYTKDENGKPVICPDLFDKEAREIAESFFCKYTYVDEYSKKPKENIVGISITQLRRLFDEVKRFRQILETAHEEGDTDVWAAQLPYIKMIRSKLKYTIARMIKNKSATKNYYRNLSSFIDQCIDLIKEQKDYFVFCSLFEAVYGFYYENAPKE